MFNRMLVHILYIILMATVCCLNLQIPFNSSNITMYNIIVMDQYSPAIVTAPANISFVEISQFPYNGTSIVANREYTITVSAISDQGTGCPSHPTFISKFAYSLLLCIVKHGMYVYYTYIAAYIATYILYVVMTID